MTIKQIYPTNIIIKQLDIDDADMLVIESYLKAQHANFMSMSENDIVEYRTGNEDIISSAINDGLCPPLEGLVDQIKDSFIELAYSNVQNLDETNNDKLALEAKIDTCKINLMKHNTRMDMHTQFGDDAFACFYFNDLEEKDGGELVLFDPRWSRNYYFGGTKLEKIRPKRKMLVVVPSYIWHEVKLYTGKADRLTLNINAQVVNTYDKFRYKK